MVKEIAFGIASFIGGLLVSAAMVVAVVLFIAAIAFVVATLGGIVGAGVALAYNFAFGAGIPLAHAAFAGSLLALLTALTQ